MTRLLVRAGKLPYQRADAVTTAFRNLTGTNVGNMLFQHAVVKALSLSDSQIAVNGFGLTLSDADRINDNCDALVLPLANQFRPRFASRLTMMAKTIRKLKVPVVVVGVGCQTDLDYDFTKLDPIREEVKDFVGAVLDHSNSIGVRGECTAEYLKSLGFESVEIIGCPSMFMNGPELPPPSRIDGFDRTTRISVNISAVGEQAHFSTGLAKMGQVIARAVAKYDDVEFVPQQRDSLVALLLGSSRQTPEPRAIPRDTYEKLYEAGRIVAFVDPRTWIDHLAARDFVFGTRLHGGIAAVLGGTPAHLIAHDSRTLELARYHEIPHVTIRSPMIDHDPSEIYDRSDYAGMLSGHARRFDVYSRFLRSNGLQNVFTDGDGGAAFEQRMSAVQFAPAIVSGTKLHRRIPWVRELFPSAANPGSPLTQ